MCIYICIYMYIYTYLPIIIYFYKCVTLMRILDLQLSWLVGI